MTWVNENAACAGLYHSCYGVHGHSYFGVLFHSHFCGCAPHYLHEEVGTVIGRDFPVYERMAQVAGYETW